MSGAASAYERLHKRYPDAGGEDYIFLPHYTNRTTAARIFERQFNELLDAAGLKHDLVMDTERSVYCLHEDHSLAGQGQHLQPGEERRHQR